MIHVSNKTPLGRLIHVVILTFASCGLVSSCSSKDELKSTVEYDDYNFTGDLADCKMYIVYNKTGSYSMTIVRCPHSSTIVSSNKHKTPVISD